MVGLIANQSDGLNHAPLGTHVSSRSTYILYGRNSYRPFSRLLSQYSHYGKNLHMYVFSYLTHTVQNHNYGSIIH